MASEQHDAGVRGAVKGLMRYRILFAITIVSVCAIASNAHRSGCHRWHSCPSDSGSYVCGDTGHCSACPDNQFCQGGQPGRTTRRAEEHPQKPIEKPAEATSFEGKVVSVKDGDTIEVMHEGKAERIRLQGIDCPEKTQAFGTRAKEFTGEMSFGKDVKVIASGRDRYGRTLGEIILPDGKNLNQELVAAGLAWWYRQYSIDEKLEKLESEAKALKRGLWADKDPMAPWDFRRRK